MTTSNGQDGFSSNKISQKVRFEIAKRERERERERERGRDETRFSEKKEREREEESDQQHESAFFYICVITIIHA